MKNFINSLAWQMWQLLSAQSPQHYQGIWLFLNWGGGAHAQMRGDLVEICLLQKKPRSDNHHNITTHSV